MGPLKKKLFRAADLGSDLGLERPDFRSGRPEVQLVLKCLNSVCEA